MLGLGCWVALACVDIWVQRKNGVWLGLVCHVLRGVTLGLWLVQFSVVGPGLDTWLGALQQKMDAMYWLEVVNVSGHNVHMHLDQFVVSAVLHMHVDEFVVSAVVFLMLKNVAVDNFV